MSHGGIAFFLFFRLLHLVPKGHINIRGDALGLDGSAVGRIISGNGILEPEPVLKGFNRLNDPFPKEVVPRIMARLWSCRGTCHNFRCTGRAAVDEHRHGIGPFHRIRPSIKHLGVLGLTSLDGNDNALVKNRSDIATAWFKSPPGLFLKSMINPFSGTSPDSSFVRASTSSSAVLFLKFVTQT